MIGEIVVAVAYVLTLLIFVRAVLTWFPNIDPRNPFVEVLFQVTEPFLAPIRSLMPRMAMDFSPMIAGMVLLFVAQAVASVV